MSTSRNKRLRLAFYGDDFTGSTDALEQAALAGFRAALFLEPPSKAEIARYPGLDVVGIAGKSRALLPREMERELRPSFQRLKELRPAHVHYKVCSTFDSSAQTGSIGKAIDIGASVFKSRFVPVLAAAPALGRYTVFGNHFARFGTDAGARIHRLDRHPSMSRHPVTPMLEADLAVHLARQTSKRIGVLNLLQMDSDLTRARQVLGNLVREGHEIVLFDALHSSHVQRIGKLLDGFASVNRPLFWAGSSAIEAAIGAVGPGRAMVRYATPVTQMVAACGSCSPVTGAQIRKAVRAGFAEVRLRVSALSNTLTGGKERHRITAVALRLLLSGKSVIIHSDGTSRAVSRTRVRSDVLGELLGDVVSTLLRHAPLKLICLAGGDTSSFAARRLGIRSLEIAARFVTGAPICRVRAPGSAADGCLAVFKGGQVGGEDFFEQFLGGGKND